MKKFTLILSLLVAMVTTAMGQTTYEQKILKFKVTACNETTKQSNGREGGTEFIWDDNNSTFYHSDWKNNYDDGNSVNKGKDGLQAFMVELPAVHTGISKITYAGRSDNNGSGWARKVRIYMYETLPTGLPEDLSTLNYVDKQELLKREENTVLGNPAFDNYESAWANNQNLKTATFETPQTAKYILFVMDEGSDLWLTCSQFNIYQNATSPVEPNKPYFLKIKNPGADGDWYMDIRTTQSTINRSQTPVAAYFSLKDGVWNISASPGPYKEFVGVNTWKATVQQENPANFDILSNDDGTISLLQNVYHASWGYDYCFIGKQDNSQTVLYTDKQLDGATKIELVELNELETAKENARVLLKKQGVGFPAADSEARTTLEAAMNGTDAATINEAVATYKATFDENTEIANVVLPETGKVYRIVSALPGFANRYVKKAIYNDKTILKWKDYDASDISQMWAVQSFTSGDSQTLKIINVANAMYPQSTAFSENVIMSQKPIESSWEYLGEGQFKININKMQGLHAEGHSEGNGNNGNIINYNTGKDGASAWYFEEVDVTEDILDNVADNVDAAYVNSYLINKSNDLEAAVNSAKEATSDYAGALKSLLATLNETEFSYIDQAYIYLKSKGGNRYIYNDNNENLRAENNTKKSVLKLTKANEGTYYIQTDGGFYSQGVAKSQITSLGANKVEYTINHFADNHYVLRPTSSIGEYQYLHDDGNNKVVGWSTDEDNTRWSLEPLAAEELEKIYTVNISSEVPVTVTYNNEDYTGNKVVKNNGGFYMLDAEPAVSDFAVTGVEAPMEYSVKVDGKNISLLCGFNRNNVFILRCVKDNSYARYHSGCQLSANDSTNMLTWENGNCRMESLFFIEDGTGEYEGYKTIRPAVAPERYVYNLGTADENSKVATKEAPTEGGLTGAYYWKITQNGEDTYNITPYHEGGNTGDTYGWNKRGSYDGKNHIGYWNNNNNTNDNKWYVRTIKEEFTIPPFTDDDSVLGYATYESVKDVAPYKDEDIVTGEILEKLKSAKNAGFAIVLPKVGSYYTLQNEASSMYMTGYSNEIKVETEKKESESIFYLDEGNKLMSYCSGQYLNAYAKGYSAIGAEVAGAFANDNYKANILAYSNYESSDAKTYWTYGANNTGSQDGSLDRGSGNTKPNNTGYNWVFTKVTTLPVTISSVGYATFYAPVAVEIPENVKAYYLINDKEHVTPGYISLTEIEGDVIPANIGVILEGPEGTHDFNITEYNGDDINSVLTGTVAATYVTEEAYVLSAPNGEVANLGLYPAALNKLEGAAFKNNSHKAYLPKGALSAEAQNSNGFRFDFGGTTAIEEVEGEDEGVKVIYDLAGRRLDEITVPGVYIVNGKKLIVR